VIVVVPRPRSGSAGSTICSRQPAVRELLVDVDADPLALAHRELRHLRRPLRAASASSVWPSSKQNRDASV
jgi:hypothetical protein